MRTFLEKRCGEGVSENIGRCMFRNRPQEQEGELMIYEAERRT